MNLRNLQTIKFRKLQWTFLIKKFSKSKHVTMSIIDIKDSLIQSLQEIIDQLFLKVQSSYNWYNWYQNFTDPKFPRNN